LARIYWTFISTEGAYRDAGTAYFTILLFSLPSFIIGYGLNGLLQARGDTVSMQYALIGAFFANIGLNPLMMFGIPGIWNGMGFDGIAAATVISQTGVMIFIRLSACRIIAHRSEKICRYSSRFGGFTGKFWYSFYQQHLPCL
jgi:Na+-driven multidrug efflux pump